VSIRGDCAGCDEDMNIHSDLDTAAMAEDIMLEDTPIHEPGFDEPDTFNHGIEHDVDLSPVSHGREPWRDEYEDF